MQRKYIFTLILAYFYIKMLILSNQFVSNQKEKKNKPKHSYLKFVCFPLSSCYPLLLKYCYQLLQFKRQSEWWCRGISSSTWWAGCDIQLGFPSAQLQVMWPVMSLGIFRSFRLSAAQPHCCPVQNSHCLWYSLNFPLSIMLGNHCPSEVAKFAST